MLLNGKDIKEYGAELLSYDNQHMKVTSEYFYQSGIISPIFFKRNTDLADIIITLGFYKTNTDIEERISNLISDFKAMNTFGISSNRNAICAVTDTNIDRKSYGQYHQLEITCVGYEEATNETLISANKVLSKEINYKGNIDTPLIIEITPGVKYNSIDITGVSEDKITIKNLEANSTIEISDGKVTEGINNKYSDTDMWQFPKLKKGSNTIGFSNAYCNVTLRYKERWI